MEGNTLVGFRYVIRNMLLKGLYSKFFFFHNGIVKKKFRKKQDVPIIIMTQLFGWESQSFDVNVS
jgi:hypothetical protein